MKKSGIINAELMKALTLARHGHMITICKELLEHRLIKISEDIIDLSLTAGIPSFFDTLKAVLNEIIVEKFIVVDHMEIYNPQGLQQVQKMMIKQEQENLDFELFIERSRQSLVFIRTGELMPDSNIILVSASGVAEVCTPLNVNF
jgi:D-ribose pyranase